MKTYEQILAGLRACVWDGTSAVRCATGVFTADAFRRALRLAPDAEVYMIGSARRGVPHFVGCRYDTEEGETTAECARFRVAELAEAEYNAQAGVDSYTPFPRELIDSIEVGDSL